MSSTNNKRFIKLCNSLSLPITQSLQKTEITGYYHDQVQDVLEIWFNFNDEVITEDFFYFHKCILNNAHYRIMPHYNFDILQYKQQNIISFIEHLLNKSPKYVDLKQSRFHKLMINKDNHKFEFIVNDEEEFNFLKPQLMHFVDQLKLYGFKHLDIQIKYAPVRSQEFNFNSNIQYKKEEIEEFNKLVQQLEQNRKIINNSNNKIKTTKRWSQKKYQQTKINEISLFPEKSDVEINGEIFEYDLLTTKNDKFIYSLSICDYEDAITVKWFRDEALDENIVNNDFIKGKWISVRGTTAIQSFGKSEWFIYMDNYEIIESMCLISSDEAPQNQKRIELHVSSKLNTMDGIIEPEEIIQRAKKFAMPAVAISDLDAVQGYPRFYQAAKKANIKAIYGASYSTYHKQPKIFLGSIPKGKISEQTFVCFDIETTGLSPRFHELIEYGSFSINVEKPSVKPVQFLIKPKGKIKPFTTSLTGITQSDIDKKGIDYRESLQKIYDDLNGKIALAHNAKFDFNFIKEQFRIHNMPFPDVCVIDTLVVSRLMFPERKKHSLGDLANNLDVNYDPNVAHRADYDAKVLADVWVEMMDKMRLKDVLSFEDLLNYQPEHKYKERFPYTISTLVKNQQGLKKQFKMISDCLTTNYSFGPKTYLEDIKKDDDLLIGSGTLRSKLIDDYFYSNHEEFLNEILRYDYIEIPAPQCFQHWIDTDFITKEQLYFALKEIIITAKEFGKIPIATADVRYLDLVDKKAFEILVYAKGIGASRHYLYDHRRAKSKTLTIPNQHFLTTQEMLEQFSFLNDVNLINEIVVKNTQKIADMIENVEVIKDKLYTPVFDDSKTKLRDLVYQNAKKKYGVNLPDIVKQRIEAELTPIIKYGFDVIYWISHKLVKKSLDEGYVVGSRGSVGSSLVATLSDISEVNPLAPHYVCEQCKHFELANIDSITSCYDLPDRMCNKCKINMNKDGHSIAFETFLGFEADKVPDIDLNFSGEFQGEVHNETKKIFGQSHTLRAGTISTIAFKTGYGYVKSFLEESEKKYSDSFASFLAKKIEGVKRTTGQHPGGIIIIPTEYDVFDFTPVNYPADDTKSTWLTTHFEYKAIHDNVLKLDLLGHDNPTIIKMLEKYTGIKIASLPKNDENLIKVFTSTQPLGIKPQDIGGEQTGAIGLPEFGTKFVRQMLTQAQPKSFADLVSISGLSHGESVWIGNNQDLIMSQGFVLPEIFSCRDDILASLSKQGVPEQYAFNIMEKVRKGKGINEEEENKLIEYKIPTWQIESMKKIKYMFPKAHAVAYVLMAWWIAWFKIYKPLAFYAAYYATHSNSLDIEGMIDVRYGKKAHNKLIYLESKTKNELESKEKIIMPTLEITRELYARGLYISNIDIEKSLSEEWLIDEENNCLIPPFSALDGLGKAVADSIINARTQKAYTSIQDFTSRAKVNKTLTEKLRELGAFGNLDDTDQIRLF
ncbi:PolC-type DNA polymerase III [Mycoplasmopsis phocirhinis]|uniref:DNA polymerase III PolC-type n=1 Tax=Mycoplasmopsis phocirhinis TaxID=142650 RepID=A0A4P6MMK2_9BACT|nr:PolC-type DNA polymerase III [Mycoplasmopsis phocirhinis]QBF34865.1 PolC-type DNA polymerase III [Mycoplasmopsis phocirhinis]